MAYHNQNLAEQTLTDAGVINFNPADELEGIFEGSVLFTMTGTQVTGTLSGSCQLQGSNSADFSTGSVDLGSPVALSDGVAVEIPLSGNTLYYAYYRVQITGSGTQSTTVVGTYTMKGR